MQVAFLNQKRFMNFFEGFGFFADGDGDRAHAHGPAAVILGHDAQHAFVHLIEAGGVDLEQFQSGGGGGFRDFARGAFLGVVAAEIDEIVGDARRAAGAGGDLGRAALIDGHAQQAATALDDPLEGGVIVVVEPRLEGEARAQGCSEQAGAGRGPDQRKARNRQADAAGVGALVDHDIEPEVFHRRVEILLDGFGDAVDFVDKENVAFLETGKQAREIAGFFDDRAGSDAHGFAQFVAEDKGEGGLAEAGRAGEENVIEGLAAFLGGADHDFQTIDRFELTGKIGKRKGPQRGFGGRDGGGEGGGEKVDALVGIGSGHGIISTPARRRGCEDFRRSEGGRA